ncbi:MAG: hypothetical protein GY867_00030 [bacterium]|nr:hypothetical protein [bacterium]
MSSHTLSRTLGTAVLVLGLILLFVPNGRAQLELELSIADVIGYPDGQDIGVDVFMSNYTDTVAGFQILFQVDRPLPAHFQLEVDTVGTLVSGWYDVICRYLSSDSTNLVVTGLAQGIQPNEARFIPPQADGLPLLRLRMSVEGNPDPLSAPVVNIIINSLPDQFQFIDASANFIACSAQQLIDTSYFRCLAWAPPDEAECLEWTRVPLPPFDMMTIDTTLTLMIDHDKVALHEGTMTIVPGVCGDVDGSFDRIVDISDAQRMIDHLSLSLKELPSPSMGNTDGSTDFVVDIEDLHAMISHLFIGLEGIDCGL